MSGAHFGPTPDNIRDELSKDPESRRKRTRSVPKRLQDCSTGNVESDNEDLDLKLESSPSQKTKRIITRTNSGKVGFYQSTYTDRHMPNTWQFSLILDRVSSLQQVCSNGVSPGEPPPEQTLQVTPVRVMSLLTLCPGLTARRPSGRSWSRPGASARCAPGTRAGPGVGPATRPRPWTGACSPTSPGPTGSLRDSLTRITSQT